MTTTKPSDALQRTIAYLGAVEVAEKRYGFEFRGRWYSASDDDVLDVERFANDFDIETGETLSQELKVECYIVSLCDDEGRIARLPSWWTPERRELNRCPHGIPDYKACADSQCGLGDSSGWERVTADLETGAEVPA